ncbi:DUF5610 domain-containing protein [Psychromonas aquimarina]|uniref:DUF5610 domain-containing protein n=1 Tax=Psychromonas aquimarina TaxID=444919 RepID=UPI0003FD4AB5|nr:DUF5610 domain-containing protein [Psychromonas aquimarina]
MNVHFDLSSPLLTDAVPLQKHNLSVGKTEVSMAAAAPKVAVEAPQSAEDIRRTKQILRSALHEYSPQKLNQVYESAVDNRVTIYSQNEQGEPEPHKAFIDKVTRRVNYGKAQGESAEQLNSLMDRISRGAEEAYSETRNILAGLSKLDPATESYISESQSYTRLGVTELSSKIGVDEQFDKTTDHKKEFSLQVTTREGDEISISIRQSRGVFDLTRGDEISVKYEVEGDLSASEHEALSDLMNAVGSASDSLLAGGDLNEIMGIKEFNGRQLADFSLNLKGSGQTIEYYYDQDGRDQNLQGSWTQDNQVMAKFSLNSKFGGTTNEYELAQYLDLIEEAADASYKFNENEKEKDRSSDLFKNTLTNFMNLAEDLGKSLDKADKKFDQARTLADTLFTKMNHEQSTRLGLKDEDKARFKEGFNRMVDFSANFMSNEGGMISQGGQDLKTGYQIDLKQRTSVAVETTPDGIKDAVKQTRTVQFDGVMRGGISERDHRLNEKYEVSAVIQDFSMQAMKQNRDSKEYLREKIYHGLGEYRFQETERESESSNSLYFLKEGSLELSRLEGQEKFKKGFMAGDKITSQIEGGETYNYNAELLIKTEQDFRDAKVIEMSIESQKKLLDEVLDVLK